MADALLPNAGEIRARLAQQLDDLRTISLADVRVLALHPLSIPRIFGTKYDAEAWCYAHRVGLLLSSFIREGQSYFGGRDLLDGGDDAIRAMMADIEREHDEAAERERERQSKRPRSRTVFDVHGRVQ
jgi:hypothetical protein